MHRWFFLFQCLLLAACCGSTRQTSSSISVWITEYNYRPTEWRIPAGKEITLAITNQGKLPHEWILLKDPPDEPFDAQEESNILYRVKALAGESLTVTFHSPAAPGEYSVTSGLPGDLEKGIIAKLVVVQPGY